MLAVIWYVFNTFSDELNYVNSWQQSANYQVHTVNFDEISRFKSGKTGYVYGVAVNQREYLSLNELTSYLGSPAMATVNLPGQGAGVAYFITPYDTKTERSFLVGIDFVSGRSYGSHFFPEQYYENKELNTWRYLIILLVVTSGVCAVVYKDYLGFRKVRQ